MIIEYCPHGNLLDFLRKRREIFEATWTTPTEHADETFTTIDLYICALQVARAMEFLASRRVSLSRSSKWPIRPGAIPSFVSMKRGVLLLPLDGMLFNRGIIPSCKFAGIQLFTWVERGTVTCLAQEHNTTSMVTEGSNPDRSVRW